jgi:8-oxo-dGTP pyrophosphatase MutT (NUDIX family)
MKTWNDHLSPINEEPNNVCCGCGKGFHATGVLCEVCSEWGVERKDVLPTVSEALDAKNEQFHRIGKGGGKYWGKKAAGILYTDGQHILLLKRDEKSDNPKTWGIPGGKAKKNESPIDTALRETKEECGIAHVGQQFANFLTKDGSHSFMCYLYSVDEKFDCELSDEHTDYEWIKLDKVTTYDLHPKFKEVWGRYKSAIKNKFGDRIARFSEWSSDIRA